MSAVPRCYKKGWRFYSKPKDKFFGPIFNTEDEIFRFFEWYDGDLTNIDSWVDENTWEQTIKNFRANKPSTPKQKDDKSNVLSISLDIHETPVELPQTTVEIKPEEIQSESKRRKIK